MLVAAVAAIFTPSLATAMSPEGDPESIESSLRAELEAALNRWDTKWATDFTYRIKAFVLDNRDSVDLRSVPDHRVMDPQFAFSVNATTILVSLSTQTVTRFLSGVRISARESISLYMNCSSALLLQCFGVGFWTLVPHTSIAATSAMLH